MLVAGYDEGVGPSLYFMDYLSSCVKMPFAIHGYGSFFGLSICDKYYKPDMNETEALALLNKIIAEVCCQNERLASLGSSCSFLIKTRLVEKNRFKSVS